MAYLLECGTLVRTKDDKNYIPVVASSDVIVKPVPVPINCTNSLNTKLALLIGWTNIVESGGSLLGTPPNGSPNSRDQMLVPNWNGDWKACGLLIVRYFLSIVTTDDYVGCAFNFTQICGKDRHWHYEPYCSHLDRDAAMRQAIVWSVITKLENQTNGH